MFGNWLVLRITDCKWTVFKQTEGTASSFHTERGIRVPLPFLSFPSFLPSFLLPSFLPFFISFDSLCSSCTRESAPDAAPPAGLPPRAGPWLLRLPALGHWGHLRHGLLPHGLQSPCLRRWGRVPRGSPPSPCPACFGPAFSGIRSLPDVGRVRALDGGVLEPRGLPALLLSPCCRPEPVGGGAGSRSPLPSLFYADGQLRACLVCPLLPDSGFAFHLMTCLGSHSL